MKPMTVLLLALLCLCCFYCAVLQILPSFGSIVVGQNSHNSQRSHNNDAPNAAAALADGEDLENWVIQSFVLSNRISSSSSSSSSTQQPPAIRNDASFNSLNENGQNMRMNNDDINMKENSIIYEKAIKEMPLGTSTVERRGEQAQQPLSLPKRFSHFDDGKEQSAANQKRELDQERTVQNNKQVNKNDQGDVGMINKETTKTTATKRLDHLVGLALPVVDIISIGSINQPELQNVQKVTFGSHSSVRQFKGANEYDDSETNCTQHLTDWHIQTIPEKCHALSETSFYNNNKNNHQKNVIPANMVMYEFEPTTAAAGKSSFPRPYMLQFISKLYFNASDLLLKQNPFGWVCAQKRPFDAFYNFIQKYYHHQPPKDSLKTASSAIQNNTSTTGRQVHLPDYLFLIDDDTWLNLDLILPFLSQASRNENDITNSTNTISPPLARVVAGCLMYTTMNFQHFTFPYGGFGIILNKQALKQLLQPLYCDFANMNPADLRNLPSAWLNEQNEPGNFQDMACWRLARNAIGELPLFRNGMSIADLMHSYVTNQEFRNVEQWTQDKPGFCFHSDMAWGYFISYYHLSIPQVFHSASVLNQHHRPRRRRKHASKPRPTLGNPSANTRTFHMNRLLGYNGTSKVKLHRRNTAKGQCQNGNDLPGERGDAFCTPASHVCHRITTKHMQFLHASTQQRQEQQQKQKQN